KLEEKQLEEEQAAKAQYWKPPVCCDDDDDEESSKSLKENIIFELPPCVAVTPKEPVDSLIMGDEHLNTISTTELDEFIKSCVENLVPNPSESEGKNDCDVPAGFTTFSNALFDADYDSESSDDQSLPDEDVPEKIYSNPLFDEEIIPIEIDPHSFNAESDLIKSMLIMILQSLFLRILILFSRSSSRLLYDNSSPRPPEEFVSDNSNADIKSFSPSPIPIKDIDSHMEETDLSLNPVKPNSRDFTMDVVENISSAKEPQVLNALPTHPTLQLNMKFQPSSESLFAYVVWIFLPFLVYSVVPCYLLSLRNEDIIFDPGICKYHFSKPDISHRCGTSLEYIPDDVQWTEQSSLGCSFVPFLSPLIRSSMREIWSSSVT
nr:hypothetical protein [Tanacetum cinerariifolium]